MPSILADILFTLVSLASFAALIAFAYGLDRL